MLDAMVIYPSVDEVSSAKRPQLIRWWETLPVSRTLDEADALTRIIRRLVDEPTEARVL